MHDREPPINVILVIVISDRAPKANTFITLTY
jgi:hypothetical protein